MPPILSDPYVLIVDDDSDLRLILKMLIEQMFQYRVQEAGSGEMALELAQTEQPVLILMDLVLPMMSGLETIIRLRAYPATQDIPIIVISDYAWATDIKDKAAACGAVHCIDKTYLLEQLPAVLAPLLNLHLETNPS